MKIPKLVLPLDIPAIEKCLPHRYPFLLIDKVVALTPGESVQALKAISGSDPILQGHFPGHPIYPGVLIIEGLAQASGVLGFYSRKEDAVNTLLLTEVEKARFRKKVEPGETLHYEVAVERQRGDFFWFDGKASVGDNLVAHVKFSALMK